MDQVGNGKPKLDRVRSRLLKLLWVAIHSLLPNLVDLDVGKFLPTMNPADRGTRSKI